MAKDKRVHLGVKGEAESFRDIGARPEPVAMAALPHEKEVRPGRVVSRLDHDALLSYNGESIMIPARGLREVGDVKKLGALPRGVVALSNE